MKLSEFIINFQYTNNGVGKQTSINDVDIKQLLVGIAVEMEHNITDLNVAASTAIDHLTENDKYYIILLKSGLVDEKKALYLGNKLLNIDAGEDEPHESNVFIGHDSENSEDGNIQIGMNSMMDTTTGTSMTQSHDNDDKDLTDELLGYKPKNVGDMDEEIVGSNGAESVVGGQSSISNTDDGYSKYQEYEKKDFNTLPDNEKEEYFNLWTKYKKNR